jgi:hypothetical protein
MHSSRDDHRRLPDNWVPQVGEQCRVILSRLKGKTALATVEAPPTSGGRIRVCLSGEDQSRDVSVDIVRPADWRPPKGKKRKNLAIGTRRSPEETDADSGALYSRTGHLKERTGGGSGRSVEGGAPGLGKKA